jgi:signal transduction histidine kinase
MAARVSKGDASERDDDRALRRLLLSAMALGFLALIGAGVAAWWNTERNQQYNRLVDHTYQVREALATLQIALEQSETARRGYLLAGDAIFEQAYADNVRQIEPLVSRIVRLVADNPRQTRNIGQAQELLQRIQIDRDRSMREARIGDGAAALAEFSTDGTVTRIRAVRARLRAMVAEEGRLLAIRTEEQDRSARTFLWLLTAAGILVVAVALTSLLVVLRYTRDLGRTGEQLRELNETLEAQVSERTADLSRANDEIQRFAYIVSHDLRSPLVNVMGFTAELSESNTALAELVDRAEADAPAILTAEAREAARRDLPEAIGFIRTSTEKMDRLINAILKLSREGRRTITPEPISMDRTVETIRGTLAHQLDAKSAEIVVPRPLPGIVSDRLSVEQVFGNVIENAVKYLDTSRPGRIEVRGRAEGTRAVYEIEDNGRGIAPADHARIFDLFRRAGQQDQPGEGIGLAHVRALTYRLGGTIDVQSELGRGATFRIILPLRYNGQTGLTA